MHPLWPARLGLFLFGGLTAAMVAAWPVCAAWAMGGLAVEVWSWFATRGAARGKVIDARARLIFAANYLAMNLWWLLLSVLFWSAGGVAGHASAVVIAMALAAIVILLFYNVPAIFLAAGAGPALGAMTVMALAAGMGWTQLLPVLMSIVMAMVFCLGRALETPSMQQSSRRLNLSLKKFEVLAENVPDVIAQFDLEGRYTYISPASLAVLGYAPSELVGRSLTDVIHPDEYGPVAAVLEDLLRDPGEAQVVNILTRHKDGRTISIQTSIKLIHEGGVPVGAIGVSRDVTERVAAEAALQAAKADAEVANRAKSEFLANVSHELRTPLNGVMGVLHLIKQEPLSAEAQRLLAEAIYCGGAITELVNDILDLSKLGAGRLELHGEPVDVAAMIQGVSDILRPQIEAKGLAFEVAVDPAAHWMYADPIRLRQVLFNLIGNASKFTHRGGVSLKLACQGAGEARRLRIEVTDTGIGMSPEILRGLFVEFHQGDGSATREFGGTGLGLVIARTIIEQMGGAVGVQSAEGVGSTFWVDLPAPAMAAPEAASDDANLLDGMRILVVEDNATNRLIATKLLENLGAVVEVAANGALGVEAMQTGVYDLVFMDIQMPVMDGLCATVAIRALPGPAGQTPIIAVTANVMKHQLEEYVRAGMNGLIAKPLSPTAIVAEIARLAA